MISRHLQLAMPTSSHDDNAFILAAASCLDSIRFLHEKICEALFAFSRAPHPSASPYGERSSSNSPCSHSSVSYDFSGGAARQNYEDMIALHGLLSFNSLSLIYSAEQIYKLLLFGSLSFVSFQIDTHHSRRVQRMETDFSYCDSFAPLSNPIPQTASDRHYKARLHGG